MLVPIDENVNDEDKEYLEMLAQNEAITALDEKEDDDALKEELEFESPLDNIDVYIRFRDTFRNVQQHQQQSYAVLIKDLPAEGHAELRQILATAGMYWLSLQRSLYGLY